MSTTTSTDRITMATSFSLRSSAPNLRHPLRRLGLVLALSGAASGCVSSSLSSDLSRIQSLSQATALPALPAGKVDTGLAREAKEQLDQPLDANAAVRLAMLNNRDLRARLRALGVERGRLMQAGLLSNPHIEAELMPERNSRLEVRAEYDVMSFVLMPMRKKAAQHELEAARTEVAGDVIELGYQTRVAFYALQAAELRLSFALRSLEALAASRDAAEALFAAGNIPELDWSTQISAYERARIAVAKLELARAEAREHLQRLLGLHGADTQWTLHTEFDDVPDELDGGSDVEKRALEANLDLLAKKHSLEALARRTGVTRLEGLLPEIAVDVHSLIGTPEGQTDYGVRWGGGVGLAVPLFDRRQGEVRSLEAQFDSELERYQGLAISVRSQAREAWARVRSAHERVRKYREVIVPAQERVMQQTQLQYNAMQLGVFQLLEARRAQLDVALDFAETLREYFTARAELDALLSGRAVSASRNEAPSSMSAPASANRGGH